MTFVVKIKFVHKGSKRIEVESEDSYTAIIIALQTLNLMEKRNISAVLIADTKY